MSVQLRVKDKVEASILDTPRKRKLLSSFRYLEEVMRELKNIKEDVDALTQMSRQHRQAIAKVMEIAIEGEEVFTVTPKPDSTPHGGKSKPPRGYKNITVEDMKKLMANYKVVQELYRKFYALKDMEGEIGMKFAGMDYSEAIAGIRHLQNSVQNALDDAFKFLQKVSSEHVPRKLAKFTTTLGEALASGIECSKILQYLYIYARDGDIFFSHYFHLQDVHDDEKNFFTSKFIIVSMNADVENQYYVTVHHEFEPPGNFQLGRRVDSVPQAISMIDMLLAEDKFVTSLGKMSLKDLLDPDKITPDQFTYKDSIGKIVGRENELEFVLRPEVTDTSMIEKIGSSLFNEMRALVTRRGAAIRMRLGKRSGRHVVTFYFIAKNGRAVVSQDELVFLQDRFNLNNDSLDRIVRIINRNQE